MTELADRLAKTRQLITDECLRLNRPEPTLIVVTKNHDLALAKELYDLGERDFGENRVQEGLPKSVLLKELVPQSAPTWHLIGQLQTNKVKQALEFATVIHSLDRESLLTELAKRTVENVKALDVFIQVNLTDDPNRGGVNPTDLESFTERVLRVGSLNLRGLMAVASLETEASRDFANVAELSQVVQRILPSANQLSIGMSNDFLQALQFGATHLRIGTAITGNRQY